MKKLSRMLSIVLSIILTLSLTVTSYANSSATNAPRLEDNAEIVTWNDLPEAYQEIIDQDAIIYKNADGTFEIFQETPIDQTTRALERYAPNGGTYSNFSNSSYGGSTIVYLIYQTYMPADAVGKYLV